MSSKLIRAGDHVQQQIAAWHPAGSGGPPAQSPAQNAVADARLADLERQTEARVKAAYQQGQAAGAQSAAQEATQRAAQRIEPAILSLNAVCGELAGIRKRFRAEAEEDTVKLAIAIARRVLRREIATDPDALLGLIKAAFQKLNARETNRLRVSGADAASIQEHRAKLDLPPGLEIATDASLPPGSAVFETSRGDLDASVDTQLSEIERGFTDIMRRRAK
jgi:flagellar assembly protein FliH